MPALITFTVITKPKSATRKLLEAVETHRINFVFSFIAENVQSCLPTIRKRKVDRTILNRRNRSTSRRTQTQRSRKREPLLMLRLKKIRPKTNSELSPYNNSDQIWIRPNWHQIIKVTRFGKIVGTFDINLEVRSFYFYQAHRDGSGPHQTTSPQKARRRNRPRTCSVDG
jgi:hypothetical protein